MKSKNLEWVAIVLISAIGVIHLLLMRGEYDEAHYMGMLFAANFAGAIIAALGIYRGSLWGWILGLFVAAGSIIGYILSRTVGFPGMETESWVSLIGTLSLLLEVGFFALILWMAPWKGGALSKAG